MSPRSQYCIHNKRVQNNHDAEKKHAVILKSQSPTQRSDITSGQSVGMKGRHALVYEENPRIQWLLNRRSRSRSNDTDYPTHRLFVEVTENAIGECYEKPNPRTQAVAFKASGLNNLKLLSWNINGLEPEYLKNRTLSILETIRVTLPDVIFLQEVVDLSFELIGKHFFTQFHIIRPDDHNGFPLPYYCVMLLSKAKFGASQENIKTKTVWFKESQMIRHLLITQCRLMEEKHTLKAVRNRTLLEVAIYRSLSFVKKCVSVETYKERTNQMRACFVEMNRAISDHQASLSIFGGDLNIRDKEARSVLQDVQQQGISPVDVWEVLGRNPRTKYTWEAKRCTPEQPLAYNYRMRFDRVYTCTPKQPTKIWHPERMQLVGNWELSIPSLYPSDHFGVFISFNKPA